MKNTKHTSICWDAHGCPPLQVGANLSFLSRYKIAGLNFVSLNMGFDLISQEKTLALIHYYRKWIKENSNHYQLIYSVRDLLEAQAQNKLGIAFDLEGCNVLNNDIKMVSHFYKLGVRQFTFTYNLSNSAGGGCLDKKNQGLTSYGKKLVKACNQVGMVIDCSHVSYQASMDIIDLSESPVVFSHSNPFTLTSHPRNIRNEQIIACAKKGGVIGINGVGIFLGNNEIRTERIVEHIDYIVQIVGPEYVGVGLDCLFDEEEIQKMVKKNPEVFPTNHDVTIAQIEQFLELKPLLRKRGYTISDINNILGKNFFRIAQLVWK